MKIKSDVPIKYALDLHLCKEHISSDGIVFEILRYLLNQLKTSEVDLNALKFTSKTLKYVFGDKLDDDFKQEVVVSIKKYIEKGMIKPKGKSMYITNDLLETYYEK